MSVEIMCDDEACKGNEWRTLGTGAATSPFMGETYAQGRYVYTIPNGWTRDEDGHYCPRCSERRRKARTA